MKYDPELECKVLLAIKERGEATTNEIQEFLTKQMQVEIEKDVLVRYLRRWKAKKIVALAYHDGHPLWKLADIPPWYISAIMTLVKGTVDADMRTAMDSLDAKLKGQGRIIQPRSVWGKYVRVQLTFETIDPILGGWLSKNDGELVIPRQSETCFIPANWFKGWFGSNAALFDLPQSIRFHVQVANAILPKFTPKSYRLKVMRGLCKFEAIPPKTRFSTTWAFPMRGCKLQSLEAWQEFIETIAELPLRGLGANPFALGGRLRLVEIKQLN